MTKTDAIIWKRIEEKAYRMAQNETFAHSSERQMQCWDAHCYKYIDTSGKINYILSQEEFDKIKFVSTLRKYVYEIMIYREKELPQDIKAMLNFVFTPNCPDFQVLESLCVIQPMWDDREKKKP